MNCDMNEFNIHKTVLITGASRGIGYAAAKEFLIHGYSVIATCTHSTERLNDLCEFANELGLTCQVHLLDFSDQASIGRFSDLLSAMSFDLLINNAAISTVGLIQDMSIDQWNQLFQVNLSSLFHMAKIAVPHFLSKGHGGILNVSSVWGTVGASCEVAYSASKGGVDSFTRALAKELAPNHIPVNAVAFGAVDTDMVHFLSDDEKQVLENEIPYGRMATTEEAGKILYQISQLPDYVTGQIITADGAWT